MMAPEAVDLLVGDVSIIDLLEGVVVSHRDVHISEGRVAAVVPSTRQQNGDYIDGSGLFMMAGLVDSHVHVAFNGFLDVVPDFRRTLSQYLLHGVTTVVDFFTAGGHFPGSSAETIRDDVNQGLFTGPRMLTSFGCLNAPGGFCDCSVGRAASAIAGPEDIERELDRICASDPDFIKLVYDDVFGTIPNLSRELLVALVRAAKDRGYRVAAHVATASHAADAVGAGVDIIGHGLIDQLPPGLTASLAQRHIPVIPTLASYEARATKRRQLALPFPSPPEVAERYAAMPRTNYEANGQIDQYQRAFRESVANLITMHDAGVQILAGSDAGTWFTFPGDSLIRELEIYVDAGMSPRDALRSATIAPDEFWSLDAGTIAAGRRADLALYSENPLKSISALRDVVGVIRSGELMDLERLAEYVASHGPREVATDAPCSPHHARASS